MLDTKSMDNKEEVKEEAIEEVKKEVKEKTKASKEKNQSEKDIFYLSSKPDGKKGTEKSKFVKMRLPHAPKGLCKTAIRVNASGIISEVKIHLLDGEIYVDPTFDELVKQMLAQDFIL